MIKLIIVFILAAALTAFHLWLDIKLSNRKKGDEDD